MSVSCCGGSIGSNEASQASVDIGKRLDEENLRRSSRELENGLLQTDFSVPDMHCVSCISTIEKNISRLSHVEKVRANLTNRRVSVSWDKDHGEALEISATLTRLGYQNSVFDVGDKAFEELNKRSHELLLALAVAGFAAANIMLLSISVWSGADAETTQLFHLISALIAVPAVFYAGRPFFRSAFAALSNRHLNMDVPISLAVLLALFMSLYESLTGGAEAYFDAAVSLLFFLLIGRYLDQLMRQKARGAVDRLGQIAAHGALLVEKTGEARFIPLAEIKKGMRLRILPGERIPVDGVIVEGSSEFDRSLVTGESATQAGSKGMVLEAGIVNLTGAIEIETTSTAENSFLAEIMKMMEAAEHGRGRYVRIAERAATIYAPVVHLLALFTFLGWMVWSGGNWHQSIYTAIAVLIITCPCALGLAVPVVHVIGANRLFDEGIIIRDGSAFERLGEIDRVVFDKTGTLTTGQPNIRKISGELKRFAPLVLDLAEKSSHPAAKAISYMLSSTHDIDASESLSIGKLKNIREIAGFGIEAEYKGKKLRLGRPDWALEIAAQNARKSADKAGHASASSAFVLQGEKPVFFDLGDELRADSSRAIKALVDAGLIIEILSGDNHANVRPVADLLGIEEFCSSVTPKEKIARIEELQRSGHLVLMAGDGLNDAPALTAGHVSIAPASASDVGKLAADFVFTRESLEAVPFAHKVARQTGRLARQNFGIAITYNLIAVPLAVTGQVTPLFAALAMSVSSIAVVANSMRLNWFEKRAAYDKSQGKKIGLVQPSQTKTGHA